MRITILKSLGLAAATSVCLASVALGQTTTTFTFLNDALGQYTMPYTATTSTGGAVVNVLCDDYSDTVNIPQSFSAFVTDVGAITNNTTTVYYQTPGTNSVFTGTSTVPSTTVFTEQENYIAAAYLAIQITALNPLGDLPAADDLSDALWNIFQPTATPLDSAAQTDLNTALQTAVSYAGLGSAQAIDNALGKDVTIYTPIDQANPTVVYQYDPGSNDQPTGCYSEPGHLGADNGCTRPQEFLAVTNLPEPSTWAVLGFDSFGAGIVGLYFLRRKSRIQS